MDKIKLGAATAQTNSAPEEPPAQRLLSFITAHFAVFSLLGLVVVVLCATLFLYGYLSTFDWQLIWIIEYTDILKFGLVASALISTVIFVFIAVIQNLYVAYLYKEKKRPSFIAMIVSFLVMIGLAGYVAMTTTTPEVLRSFATSAALLIGNSLLIWELVKNRWASILFISFLFVALIASVVVFGATLGTYTKYSTGGLAHDVLLKDRQMSNVRLVLFTSHHTVLYAGTDVIVLPTSDITKIVAHPTDQQHWPDSEPY